MRIEYWLNRETHDPHIYDHGVTESEVEEVLVGRCLETGGAKGVRIAVGQAASGRFLQVVFVRRESDLFVITAYSPTASAIRAFRRHNKKRR